MISKVGNRRSEVESRKSEVELQKSLTELDRKSRKQHGVHYTPEALADFLACQIAGLLSPQPAPLRILDPACGDGRLLAAMASRLPDHQHLTLIGFETDAQESQQAQQNLSGLDHCQVDIRQADFLESVANQPFAKPSFDIVISNPPYVRTQVLGQQHAKQLAQQFGLTGRVDMYHAFSIAILRVLKVGGVLGLLTSNRFMYVQSGTSIRSLFENQFQMQAIYDLGDTKLFTAAVLPAVLIATRLPGQSRPNRVCPFTRIYKSVKSPEPKQLESTGDLLEALVDPAKPAAVALDRHTFAIEQGTLEFGSSPTEPWRLVNPESKAWIAILKQKQVRRFSDVAEIKVGIKSTADRVFIRSDWEQLQPEIRPEPELLHPIITHLETDQWSLDRPQHWVLYPYVLTSDNKTVVNLDEFPKAQHYLQQHRQQLESRRYLIDAGRQWFEIWVPQQPQQWQQPKIVWPDISEQSKFGLDTSGAIVNGDCYWIKLKPDVDPDWMYLMLAVANSSIVTEFYDFRFHNKLYSGRRRFMTQYVREFPLPDLTTTIAKQIVSATRKIVSRPPHSRDQLSRTIDTMVRRAFGF